MNKLPDFVKLTSQTFEFEFQDGFTYRLREDVGGGTMVWRTETPPKAEVGMKQRSPLWSHGVLCQMIEGGCWKPACNVNIHSKFNTLQEALAFIV